MNRDWYLRNFPILNRIKNPRAIPTPESLDFVENTVQCQLPLAFREFLQEVNGGLLCESVFDDVKPCIDYVGDFGRSRVNVYSLAWVDEHQSDHSVVGGFGVFEDRLPVGMVPIASTGSSCLVISCRSDDNGAIYDFDRTYEMLKPPEQNLWRVADNFTAFLSQITLVDYSIEP